MYNMCKNGIFSVLLVYFGFINLCNAGLQNYDTYYIGRRSDADGETELVNASSTTTTLQKQQLSNKSSFRQSDSGNGQNSIRNEEIKIASTTTDTSSTTIKPVEQVTTTICDSSLNTSVLSSDSGNSTTSSIQYGKSNTTTSITTADIIKHVKQVITTREIDSNHKISRRTSAPGMSNTTRPKISSKEIIDTTLLELLNPFNIIDSIENNVIPNLKMKANVTYEKLGRTAEYKDIVLMKITKSRSGVRFRTGSNRYVDEGPPKKIVFIVHGLSVMGITDILDLSYEAYFEKILSMYFSILDSFDVFLIPMANPDGFEKVAASIRHGNSHWNKNVSPQEDCPGVSLDRNFDVAWNPTKKMSSCDQKYPGPYPFSEPETKAISEVFHKHGHKIIAYLNVHSGTYSPDTFKGDAVLYPKGYTDTQVGDDKYVDLKGLIDEKLERAGYIRASIQVDTLYEWYGKVTGTSVDYASTIYNIPFAMEIVMQSYDDQSITFSSANLKKWSHAFEAIFKIINGTTTESNEAE